MNTPVLPPVEAPEPAKKPAVKKPAAKRKTAKKLSVKGRAKMIARQTATKRKSPPKPKAP